MRRKGKAIRTRFPQVPFRVPLDRSQLTEILIDLLNIYPLHEECLDAMPYIMQRQGWADEEATVIRGEAARRSNWRNVNYIRERVESLGVEAHKMGGARLRLPAGKVKIPKKKQRGDPRTRGKRRRTCFLCEQKYYPKQMLYSEIWGVFVCIWCTRLETQRKRKWREERDRKEARRKQRQQRRKWREAKQRQRKRKESAEQSQADGIHGHDAGGSN